MNGFEWVLAAVLLTAPAEKLQIADPALMHGLMAPAISALALQWELLDPRENDYLKNSQDFMSDLKLLQTRFVEFHNAPLAAEAQRFPTRDLVNDMLTFNRNYRDTVNNRLALDMVHADELKVILAETDRLNRIYEAVRDARSEYYYVTYRRQALGQLRELVGADAFYAGRLPPHVPLWRIPNEQ